MVSNPSFHTGSNSETRMNTTEIVIREVQGHSGFQVSWYLPDGAFPRGKKESILFQRQSLQISTGLRFPESHPYGFCGFSFARKSKSHQAANTWGANHASWRPLLVRFCGPRESAIA